MDSPPIRTISESIEYPPGKRTTYGVNGLQKKCQSTTTAHVAASIRAAILSLVRALGLELFSFVTGDGNVGDGGGGLECRFSFKLVRDDPDRIEVQEEVDDTDRLVSRRSRILMTACIKQFSGRRKKCCYCKSCSRLEASMINACAIACPAMPVSYKHKPRSWLSQVPGVS